MNLNSKKTLKKISQYNTQVTLTDFYITKNINTLVNNPTELQFIKEHNFVLGITNKIGKNSLNILLENANSENSNIKILIELINLDVRILRFKNSNEKTFLMSIISNEDFYSLINTLLEKNTNPTIANYNQFKITLLSETDINNNSVIDLCIELLNINYNYPVKKLNSLFLILRQIYLLDKEEIFLLINKLCRDIKDENLLLSIFKFIKPENLDIHPDSYNNTCVDYLINNEKFSVLDYLLDKIEHIYFVNFEENSIFNLLNDFTNQIDNKNHIDILFKILSKSNINKLKDFTNQNLMFKLLKTFDLDKNIIKKFIKYFDIFEQNINGENLYEIIIKKYPNDYLNIINNEYTIDSQIIYTQLPDVKIKLIDYQFDIKKYLKKTNRGIFISDSLHNMIYTYIVLKHNNINLLIPYEHETETIHTNLSNCIQMTNNNKDIMGIIQFYFYNFNSWLPHLIIWKDKNNYFIYPFLIEKLKSYSDKKRFIYIKLSIIANTKEQENIRHANLILIDNLKKTVERFEPYGEIYFSNCAELNTIIQKEISNKLDYKFIFVQPYPGFQLRSNEYDQKNKSYGDPGGYCLAWCFLYLEIKIYCESHILKNSSTDSDLAIKLINNYIINKFSVDFPELKFDKQQNLYLVFIRYYSKELDKEKNKLIKNYGLNISSMYHLDLDNKIHKKIIYNLNFNIENINKI